MSPPDGAAAIRALAEAAEVLAAASLRGQEQSGPSAVIDPTMAELDRLVGLGPLDCERERRDAAKRLGIRTGALDQAVASHRVPGLSGSTEPGGGGQPVDIPDIDPWPEPVDGTALLHELVEMIRRHVVLDAAAADATALWIVHTHAIDTAYISPRLAITSPEKRCGKTTLLSILGAVVAWPLSAANITPATMFRIIEAVHPSLLIDEADTFLGNSEELRGVINAGHCRATAYVYRTVETRDGYEVRKFEVYGAIAIASIGKLPGTIEDRSLKIALRRRRRDEKVERVRLDRLDRLRPLAQRAARWAADNLDCLSRADPDVPTELHDRAADNWRPLLAIADTAGGEWPARARQAAVMLCHEGAEDADTARTMLLADLREMFGAEPSGILFTAEILELLHARDDRPWPEYRGKAITAARVAELLKPLKILSGTVRRGEKTYKGYKAEQFEDAWARYLPPPSPNIVTTSQPAEILGFRAAPAVTGAPHATAPNVPKPAQILECDCVTAGSLLGWHERV